MKYLVGIISVLVVVVLVGSVMVPIINDSTGGGVEYEDNPDWDGWVRFDLNTSAGATYQLGMWQDDNGIFVDNILDGDTDRQIYDDSTTVEYSTIMYADSNMVVWSIDDTFNVQGLSGGRPVFINAPILDIIRTAGGVEVVTDTDSVLFDAPSWAYVPSSQGKYGFYPYNEERGVEHPANAPTAVLGGGNMGIYAYNNITTYDGLGLVMNPIIEDGKYYGATWEKPPADSGEFDPDDITINPLDPSIISGGDDTDYSPLNPPIVIDDPFQPDAELNAVVPTPTYTDGDWGYDLITVNGIQKARIVSYQGVGGGQIVVPSTVGGYDVYSLGMGNGFNIIPSTVTATDLIISEGIVKINEHAFIAANMFTGTLSIPASVTSIDKEAFRGLSCTGSIILSPSLTTLGDSAFRVCNKFNGAVVIPASVTSIGSDVFRTCSLLKSAIIASDATPGNDIFTSANSITEIMDLSSTIDYSVNRYGMPAGATVYDTIGDCFGFVSIVSTTHGTSGGMGEYSNLIYAIPIVIISALLVAFGAFVIRRDY